MTTCNSITSRFLENEEGKLFRAGCIILLTAYLLFLIYIAGQIRTFYKRSNISVFTLALVILIGCSAALGTCETTIVIAATDTSRVHLAARQFAFSNCWLGVMSLTTVHNTLTYLACLILAAKYHSVAR